MRSEGQTGRLAIWTVATLALFSVAHSATATYGDCSHLGNCNSHGTCDLRTRSCNCFDGWGSTSDISTVKAPDCSLRVCPSGKAWVDIATAADKAHALAECSNAGTCNRVTGKCDCFSAMTGEACQRTKCPNGCSGHGRCVAIKDLSSEANARPFGPNDFTYGGARSKETWDEDKIFACVCDSLHTVGYASGEYQAATYFGADCSMRRCPSGDDPLTTSVDETNCFLHDYNRAIWRGPVVSGVPQYTAQDAASYAAAIGDTQWDYSEDNTDTDADNMLWPHTGDYAIVAPGSAGSNVGAKGNLCIVECSNRGLCNHKTGKCACFMGHYGHNCASTSTLADGL